MRWRWLALGPDRMGTLGAYTNHDDGWRWELRDSAGVRDVRVLPDPLLGQAGPTFAVGHRQVERRDAPAPEGTGPDGTLARLAGLRECLRSTVVQMRGPNTWGAVADSLPLRVVPPQAAPGCIGLRVEQAAERTKQPWILSLTSAGGAPLRVTYLPVFDDSAEAPFVLTSFTDGMGYMVDAHGRWHARRGGYAMATDPPPEGRDPDSGACE